MKPAFVILMISMKLSEELQYRGFINQTTFKDLKDLDKKKRTFYHGFDASADSQTIGNLAAMMFDKVFIRHGYKAILLAGGSTSLIGDPGGKDKERVLQDEKTIAKNVENAATELKRIFAGQEFTLVNNLDWTKNMTVIEYLRDIGKHYSMTPLVQRDYIAKRIGEDGVGISYAEFSYTILQGLDYLHLYDKYGVTLQLGGSDQWGNCLSGVDLIRRARGEEVHVMTLPLIINKATGKKFGKSEDGAVWLNPDKTSVFKFYQFWLNADDEGVEGYLKVYTTLDKPEIDKIMVEFNANKSERSAQKRLAYEVTTVVHGEKQTQSVKKISEVLFGDAEFLDLSDLEKKSLQTELVSVKAKDNLSHTVVDSGLASSNSEANRFIASGAIYVNGKKCQPGSKNSEFEKGLNLLRRGKNNFAIVEA